MPIYSEQTLLKFQNEVMERYVTGEDARSIVDAIWVHALEGRPQYCNIVQDMCAMHLEQLVQAELDTIHATYMEAMALRYEKYLP